jgi:hypothetical protein
MNVDGILPHDGRPLGQDIGQGICLAIVTEIRRSAMKATVAAAAGPNVKGL